MRTEGGQVPPQPRSTHDGHRNTGHGGPRARPGSRTPSEHRGPRHGPWDPHRWRSGRGADRRDVARVSDEGGDPAGGGRRRPAPGRGGGSQGRLHRDDGRADGGAPGAPPRGSVGHSRNQLHLRPFRGPCRAVRRGQLEDPGASDRVGQGRCGQVLDDHQPGCRPRCAGSGRGGGGCRRVGLLHPADAGHFAPTHGH